MVADNASCTISLYFQLVVSSVYSDVYIFHIGFMQNNDFQTGLPRSEGHRGAGLLLAWFSGYKSITILSTKAVIFKFLSHIGLPSKILFREGFTTKLENNNSLAATRYLQVALGQWSQR